MKVILFGATGMVGQGVLRECLLDPGITSVLSIGRTATGQQHPKLHEILQDDLADYSRIKGELAGFEACFSVSACPRPASRRKPIVTSLMTSRSRPPRLWRDGTRAYVHLCIGSRHL